MRNDIIIIIASFGKVFFFLKNLSPLILIINNHIIVPVINIIVVINLY